MLVRAVVSWITRKHHASRILVATLTPVIEERVGQRALGSPPTLKAVRTKYLVSTSTLEARLIKIE